ncbi:MAG TPA: hypothetical protein VKP13_17795 [Nitrospira sp.]|nr:hypothetical protein [Nitrospira sp.]
MATATTTPTSPLTPALIESVINAMPIQGRIMLHLILLQHFDVNEEEVHYMTSDRPDPRCVSGTKPTYNVLTQEAIKAVRDKRDQYLRHVRLRRERTWLQCECIKKLLSLRLAMADRAAELLATRFALSPDAIEQLKSQARTAVPRPAIRALEQRWDADEITAEEYQQQRLGIDMQVQLRLADKYKKRIDLAERERHTADYSPLQDHEIAHIWGLPAGSLQARKVKYMSQFLQSLQTAVQTSAPGADTQTVPVDLWKETFAVLATRPVERSTSVYDGLEQTESALLDKLTMLAWGSLGEDIETKFWLSLVYGGSSNAMHSEITRNLFGLHRLLAIINDIDASPEGLDEELLKRTAPTPKTDAAQLEAPAPEEPEPLTDVQQQILSNFRGEDASSRATEKW